MQSNIRRRLSGGLAFAIVVGCLLLIAVVAPARGGDDAGTAVWPQWRGPTRDGKVTGPAWPGSLAGDRIKPQWRVELGDGYSSPIVGIDRVFSVETRGEEEIVRALDRKSGKSLWEARWKGSMKVPFFAARNGSWVRATPAWDGTSLFVPGMRDVLVCLNGADGSQRWRVDFMERYKTPLPAFGFVSSPLVLGDDLYVQAGGSFLKLNKLTGETTWRTLADEGGMAGSAFSSPMFARLAGKPQLVVQTRARLAGVAPETGQVLWSRDIPSFQGMAIVNPTIEGDNVFTASYGGGSFLFTVANDAANGQDAWQAREIWKTAIQGYMSSPMVIDGYVYLQRRDNHISCVELKTGREMWKSPKGFGDYWSMAANGPMILALDQRGELFLLRADPQKMDILDHRKICDAETWGHITVCANEIFIRELNAMTCYRWQETQTDLKKN